MKYIKYLSVTAIALLSIAKAGAQSPPASVGASEQPAARDAAVKSLDIYRQLAAPDADRIDAGPGGPPPPPMGIGDPLKRYSIGLNDLVNWDAKDPAGLLRDTGQYLYSVKSAGTQESTMVMSLVNGQWQATQFGAPYETMERTQALRIIAALPGGKSLPFSVWIPALGLSFVGYQQNNELFFVPVHARPELGLEAYELREWLRLLPFTTRPEKAIEIVRTLPQAQMRPAFLEEMIEGFSLTPSQTSEEALFKLAEDEPRLYLNYRWREAVLKIGTGSAALRLIELAANGRFDGERFDLWYWARELAPQIAASGEVRRQLYDMLRCVTEPRTVEILAGIVAECADAEGLLLLVEIELRDGKPSVGWRTIERVVTKHVQDENWPSAYNVVPDPVPDLRRALLAIVRDGGLADAAARCLDYIDKQRDDHGFPPSEPRHPDLASGKAWPMMRPILKGTG